MPLEFAEGDLFRVRGIDALAHGCNCAGAMGRGIAAEFRRRWPEMYERYRSMCASGALSPGGVYVYDGAGVTVYNLGTQRHWREGATMAAVRGSVSAMLAHAADRGVSSVAMPRVGAGLGGLAWEDVRRELESIAGGSSVRVVVVSLPGATA